LQKIEGKKESVVKSPLESKLDRRLAEFISYICNIDMMRQQMLQIGDCIITSVISFTNLQILTVLFFVALILLQDMMLLSCHLVN
jgi:hypothetical protein